MPTSTTVPVSLRSLLDLYGSSEEARGIVSHNFGILKCIRGGLRLAERHRAAFNPRTEYWRLPERRLAIAYLADRWTGRFAPPAALRGFAHRVLRHFDQARTDGIVSFTGIDYQRGGGLEKICATLAEHAMRLAPIAEWVQLRNVWPKVPEEAGADIAEFLSTVPTRSDWDATFRRRFPWFAYIGARSIEDLRNEQAFFYGYANLWTTTNAYVHAGAQLFAPVIQNTPTGQMLDAALVWSTGTNPIATTFPVFGKDDDDNAPQDRSQYATVIEVYGFLNLERAPFYNNLAETYRKWFSVPKDVDAYELTARVGKVTADWLTRDTGAIDHLCDLFRKLIDQRSTTRVELETIESPKVRKIVSYQNDVLDPQLFAELTATAKSELTKLEPPDAARLALHLLLDSKLFVHSTQVPAEVTTGSSAVPPTPEPPVAPSIPSKSLPAALRTYGELALAYLKAGFNVLFAGAPGTGKTTLAQFVGYAWDGGLDVLPEQMPIAAAPLTTVGNSAWSPFHTIGGLMPTERGTFIAHAGIFIDPATTHEETWRLRKGVVVLDEMNRADLDRCIGELYPLLSGSVERVSPAGLPGVKSIEAHSRFRVVATVNDAHLDDIVFPISEGLARRFLRIELPGASREEVIAYLGLDIAESSQDARRASAKEAVDSFFELARERQLLVKTEDDDRLPFGIAYFTLLRSWIDKVLDVPLTEATVDEQGRNILASCLLTLGKTKKWREALQTFQHKA